MILKQVQLYDDKLDFDDNKIRGPFGDYVNNEVYRPNGKPGFDFFGTPVYAPFGIGAGPLPSSRHIAAALDKGFDIVTLKSVRTDVFPLNPYPQVRPVQVLGNLDPNIASIQVAEKYSDPIATANSFGIPSVHPKEWLNEMKKSFTLPKKGQALLVAFQGTARGNGRDDFVLDHVKGIGLIRKAGAKVIEINLSCPNEGEELLACFDTDITTKIVEAVRQAHPDIKLIIKLAYFANKNQLKDMVKKVGNQLDGISAINTIPVPVVDKAGKEVFPGRPKAGVSGAPIKWAGLEMTRSLVQFRKEFGYKYKIIGLGGVTSSKDFHEYIDAGADYVMSVAGAMWNPNLAVEIKKSLAN